MSSSASLHFTMPQELQNFSLFAKLPYDIRFQIWELVIYSPGIHFLKFEKCEGSGTDSSADDGDESDAEPDSSAVVPTEDEKVKKVAFTSHLTPMFPIRAADMSYYITASKTLTQLSLACQEAKDMVNKAIDRPGTLVLDNGRLITLDGSSDVICIDYPDMCYIRGLGRWSENLNFQQLSKIRRLAVRFYPEWDEGSNTCRLCGRLHDTARKEQPRRHLYEFVTLFPHLEAFYFIDYMTVRKPKDHLLDQGQKIDNPWLGPDVRRRMVSLAPGNISKEERFASGGRSYYEVDPEFCKVNTNVFNTLDWVQENFVSTCRKNANPKNHASPESVKFGVLGCEWVIDRKISNKRQIRTTNSTKRTKTDKSTIVDALSDLNLEDQRRCADFQKPLSCPVSFGDGGESLYPFNFRKRFDMKKDN